MRPTQHGQVRTHPPIALKHNLSYHRTLDKQQLATHQQQTPQQISLAHPRQGQQDLLLLRRQDLLLPRHHELPKERARAKFGLVENRREIIEDH